MASSEINQVVPETRAGNLAHLCTNKLPYTISTLDATKYLQRKLDGADIVLSNAGKNPIGAQIKLVANQLTDSCTVLLAILPRSVVERKATNSIDSDFMLNMGTTKKKITINSNIYEILKKYMYSKDFFNNSEVRHKLELSGRQAEDVAQYTTPRFEGDSVYVLINFTTLFHEMVEVAGENTQFTIKDVHARKIDSELTIFEFTRKIGNDNTGKKKPDMAHFLEQRMKNQR